MTSGEGELERIEMLLRRAAMHAKDDGRWVDMREYREVADALAEKARAATDAARNCQPKATSSELTVPKGHILDDTGTVRKLTGKLLLTNDGAVACEEGDCWLVWRSTYAEECDPYRVSKGRRSGRVDDYGCWWQVDDCDEEAVDVHSAWSTKEAAEAAQRDAGGREA